MGALRPARRSRSCSHGAAALLGDAAHPMLPFFAQGAAMAIEDAAVAARCLARMPDDPAGALKTYSAVRRGRTRKVQRLAAKNGARYHLGAAAGYDAQCGDARHGRRAAVAALRLALRLAAARSIIDQLSGATTMPGSEPLFPTTIAGSLPKPAWLAVPNKLWAPWRLARRRTRDRQGRRHAAGDQTAGGRRHRHRRRRRTVAPAFRARLSRSGRRHRFRQTRRDGHPQRSL